MPNPPASRLNLPPEEFTELALRLQAKQPQIRALAQRLLAAHLMRESLESAQAETTEKVLAQGTGVKPKLKERFLSLRKAKEDAQGAIDFYKAASDALAALFLSPLPQAKLADEAGKRMLSLGDAWEKSREDAAVRDAIRLLLRELTSAIHELPMMPPEGGLSPDQRRTQRMKEALERTKFGKTTLSKLSAAAAAASAQAAEPQPRRETFASGAGRVVPFPSSQLAGRPPAAAPLSRPVLVSSPPPSIFPAPGAAPVPSGASVLSPKPDRSEMVRQMAVQSARTRRSGVPLKGPIPDEAKSPKPPRHAKSKSKKKSNRGA